MQFRVCLDAIKLKQFLTVHHLIFHFFLCTFSEPYDVTVVTPSVLNVIHGQIVPMDLVKVETEKECFFSFLSVGWGLMADIDIESERLRAIGEARFAVWGVIRALGKYKFILKTPVPFVHQSLDFQNTWNVANLFLIHPLVNF